MLDEKKYVDLKKTHLLSNMLVYITQYEVIIAQLPEDIKAMACTMIAMK